MNTREAINKLRAQGLTDTQILDTLFPDREQEQPNQDPQGDQDPGDDDSSPEGEGDQGEEPAEDEGDNQDQGDESSEDSDDQGNEGPNSDQGQNTEPEDDSDRDSDAGNQEDAQGSNDSAEEDAQNLSWGGNSLPEGYTPDAPTPDAIREASKALHRWIKASLGGKQASSRKDVTKLCVRMTSRASLAHTHKLENTKKRLLVVIDVSISCSEYAPQYMQVTAALAKVEKRLAVLVHSNGIPLELTVDGKQRPLTQFAAANSVYMSRFDDMKAGLRNEVTASRSLCKKEFDRLWQVLNGLNLQGVLAMGDSDAETMLEYLSEQANVCYLCRTRGDVKTAQTYRQARRLSEKGCIPVLGGESVRSILKAINKLPAH